MRKLFSFLYILHNWQKKEKKEEQNKKQEQRQKRKAKNTERIQLELSERQNMQNPTKKDN